MDKSTAQGTVEAIYIASLAGQLPVTTVSAEAVAGRGLRGDRYFNEEGTWSQWPGGGREVTLIAAEVVETLAVNIRISAAEARRNVLVRDVDLNALVGREFRVGDVVFRGQRLCEPCAHLESLTLPGILAGLQGVGGLRADIVVGGSIHTGDLVSPL